MGHIQGSNPMGPTTPPFMAPQQGQPGMPQAQPSILDALNNIQGKARTTLGGNKKAMQASDPYQQLMQHYAIRQILGQQQPPMPQPLQPQMPPGASLLSGMPQQ